jgi:diadenosine tetraphosphate (Ap4A) HIT family hydrolase
VPGLPALVGIIDLESNDESQLMCEIDATARALRSATACDKLKIAALGNQVVQLHMHVIASRKATPPGPKPAWGAVTSWRRAKA